jgi:hypothetical protein
LAACSTAIVAGRAVDQSELFGGEAGGADQDRGAAVERPLQVRGQRRGRGEVDKDVGSSVTIATSALLSAAAAIAWPMRPPAPNSAMRSDELVELVTV